MPSCAEDFSTRQHTSAVLMASFNIRFIERCTPGRDRGSAGTMSIQPRSIQPSQTDCHQAASNAEIILEVPWFRVSGSLRQHPQSAIEQGEAKVGCERNALWSPCAACPPQKAMGRKPNQIKEMRIASSRPKAVKSGRDGGRTGRPGISDPTA